MHFLVFQSKRLSYDSSRCFTEMVQRSLRKWGAQVTVFSLEEDLEKQEEELVKLCSLELDGIFDINSLLPRIQIDESYYLDLFDAPFFHLIVDHPMHVHLSLIPPIQEHYVLCLDRQHKEYLEQYYPHIRGVYYMPFGGIKAEEFAAAPEGRGQGIVPMTERPYHILFPGTYTPLEYYQSQMEAQGEYLWEISQEMLQEYQKGSTRSVDDLFYEKAGSDSNFFALKMHKARFIDRYLREWYRESILSALLRQKITVDVVGMRWEMYQGEGNEFLRIHPPCSYASQLGMLAQSRMVLNVQPLFQDGPHDRVINAMMNHSVAVSDSCCFLQEQFTVGAVFFYDKNRPEEMAEWVQRKGESLSELKELEKMAERAYREISVEHTWEQRIRGFLEWVEEHKIITKF